MQIEYSQIDAIVVYWLERRPAEQEQKVVCSNSVLEATMNLRQKLCIVNQMSHDNVEGTN